MYKITLEQQGYNRIVLEHLEREEAVDIVFDLVGHMGGGAIKLEMDEETKEEAPC